MKTTDPRDPLDQKIDALLTSQPVQAPGDFVARTIAASEAEKALQQPGPGPLAPIIPLALPAVAAIALAFLLINQFTITAPEQAADFAGQETLPSTSSAKGAEALSHTEIDELLILQEGLSGFADLDGDSLKSDRLLNTLEALYSI